MSQILPWPIAVIDFEASSLDHASYPIEVGLAIWPAPSEPIYSWSTLIRPIEDWRRHGHWSQAAAKTHGIKGRDLMAHGRDPAWVAAALNAAIKPSTVVWCDGGPYDTLWANALFKVAAIAPTFSLGEWHRLTKMLDPQARDRALEWLTNASAPHRARADAELLLRALMHGLGVDRSTVQDLASRTPLLNMLVTKAEH